LVCHTSLAAWNRIRVNIAIELGPFLMETVARFRH
jgi:hypothetical protein